MSLDNRSGILEGDKIAVRLSKCPRVTPEVKSIPSPRHTHMDSAPGASPSLSSLAARPFPPPALADVPVEYIMDQLHNLAPHYWGRPETADCTIIVPVPHHQVRPSSESTAASSGFSPDSSIRFSVDPNGTGRRATEPNIHAAPRLTLRLHMDYLSAKSSFLRELFSGASPLALIQSLHMSPPGRRPSAPLQVPSNRLPRLLPSPSSHPVVFLPVPDPSSIHLLFHWMYFGDTDHIESCLDQGAVHWEGLARNVEYLGLPTDIKVFLGRWYGNWLLPARNRPGFAPCAAESGENSDVEYDDDEDEDESDCDDYSTSSSRTDEDSSPADCERGRTRAVRPLARLCGQLQMCTA
ncbi:hypothetical protein HYDPIDRAFT_172617 [Hydnomerulius pinastri MD-312]|nr:hypothetical protein HYDPIDRAFT_172617 [Hydnomerulius pinastri MD-312]